MAEKFDPYYKWLGIPPKDQPPHHYRLLGIELFEVDRDVIDAAANRLMGYLKELAAGDEGPHSQKLLNEISRARLCLLNKQKKAAYDQELREKLEAEEAKSAQSSETPPPTQTSKTVFPPVVEPPAFLVPPQVSEPPRIEIGAVAAQLDSRTKPPPLKSRGSPAPSVREDREQDGEEQDKDGADRPSGPRRSSKRWMYMAAIGMAVVGIAVVITTILLLPPTGDTHPSKSTRSRDTSKGSRPVLMLVLTAEERKEITAFFLDDQPQPLPPKAELTLEAGRHRLILRRGGYQEVFDSITLVNGHRREYRPRWRREITSGAPPP